MTEVVNDHVRWLVMEDGGTDVLGMYPSEDEAVSVVLAKAAEYRGSTFLWFRSVGGAAIPRPTVPVVTYHVVAPMPAAARGEETDR